MFTCCGNPAPTRRAWKPRGQVIRAVYHPFPPEGAKGRIGKVPLNANGRHLCTRPIRPSQKSSRQMNLHLRGPSNNQHTTIHHPLSRAPPHSIQTLASNLSHSQPPQGDNHPHRRTGVTSGLAKNLRAMMKGPTKVTVDTNPPAPTIPPTLPPPDIKPQSIPSPTNPAVLKYYRPTYHKVRGGHKLQDWSYLGQTPTLIIGDSNLDRIPPHRPPLGPALSWFPWGPHPTRGRAPDQLSSSHHS
ncbi:unnamed protein product [Boreogadus saida]